MITRRDFGDDSRGNATELITLVNKKGTEVSVSTFGGVVVTFIFADKDGVKRDVVLGYDTPAEYLTGNGYFGSCVGRNANRIGGAVMTLNGKKYDLEKNDGDNNLHSGANSTSKSVWEVESVDEEKNSVTLKIVSKDLEQDFPGTMTAKVTYTLNEEDALVIDTEAVCDEDTIANFTNHSYFNLAGHDSGIMENQKLKIYAEAYTPIDAGLIPTGEVRKVAGTAFDFTEFKEIGKDINDDDEQLKLAGGYDHNFVLDDKRDVRLMAEAVCEETGICLKAYTDLPAVQLYAGNFIGDQKGKNGAMYHDRYGFCLESQYYPNAVNEESFETPILKAGDTYHTTTIYQLVLK